MVFELLVNKIKKLFLVLLGLIKRSLCCLKRRRRYSCDSIPLTGIGVGTNFEVTAENKDIENWGWEEPVTVVSDPNSVQHHIEMYRQQSLLGPPEKAEEVLPDFFEDMTPKITKQTKIHIKSQSSQDNSSSRLNFVPESVMPAGPELGSWEESEGGSNSWEEEGAWDVSQLVREKRRAEREKLAALKHQSRSGLGSKVR